MDIGRAVKILMLVNLSTLLMYDVDASFYKSNSTNTRLWEGTPTIFTTNTMPVRAYLVETEAPSKETSFTTTTELKHRSFHTSITPVKTAKATFTRTSITTTVISMKTNTMITTMITTMIATTSEQENISSTTTPTEPIKTGSSSNNKDEHKLMFYISVGIGSVFATLLFSLIIILTRRSIRRKREKKRLDYWTKINRACHSQYIPNEEVSSNNPMYEGSRSRTTSNVLYAASEQGKITPNIPRKNDYVLNPPTQQSTQPDLVISNSCPLYQNADDIYSEPGKNHKRVEDSNYERIRSFIHSGNDDVQRSTGSYAEPSVLFNGIHITENTGYVSATYQNN